MKKIIFVLSLIFFFNCKPSIKPEPKTGFITSNELKETVSFLASDDLKGRSTGSEGIEKAAVFLENKFKTYGISPYFETYRDSFMAGDKNAYNIIGVIEGNHPALKDEFVIFGAHYDHIGFGEKVANDSIANGANDDATGTSAVLAIAKYFAAKKTNKRSLIFTLFSAEELGLIGSKKLAEHLKSKNLNLYAMLEFEMIGVPMKDKDFMAYLTGYELSNMARKINNYANEYFVGLLPKAKEYKLFYRSDNYSFFKAFNVPSQTISTFDFTNYDFYHHVDDEADRMDYPFMASLINTLIPAIEKICRTPTKEIKMTP